MKNLAILITVITFLTFSFKTSFCDDFDVFYEEGLSHFEFLKSTYRYLHQHPELGHKEFETSAYIQAILSELNIEYTTGWGGPEQNRNSTGVIAQIGTGGPPCLAFRADIDALPIHEEVNLPYKSTHYGTMHACGHDAHTTMLLGAAKMLKAHEKDLKGTVKLFFQPAEEIGGGAINMVAEGALTHYPPVQAMYGFHILPTSHTGAILSNYGPITASANNFKIKVCGKGGHAASHQMTIDPIAASMAIAQNLYTFSARELYFQTDKTGVITIGDLHTYNTESFNIIPNSMEMKGTIRTLDKERTRFIMKRMREIVEHTSNLHHTHSTLEFLLPEGSLPTYNDPNLYNFFAKIAPKAASDHTLGVRLPSLGGEDFAYFSNSVPSLLAYLGMGSGKVGEYTTDIPYHSPNFVMDENLLPRASAFYTFLAFETLENYFTNNTQNDENDEL